MKKRIVIILIVVVVLVLIGLAYYFLIYKKEQESRKSGSGSEGGGDIDHLSSLKPNDDVYINVSYPSDDIYVYSAPKAINPNVFAKSRASWYGTQPIGKFVELAGATGFVRVSFTNLQVYQPHNSANVTKISGSYFVDTKAIAKTPY